MAVTRFAAIDIGSYNVSMEIFELSARVGLKTLSRVRTSLDLGADTFDLKKVTTERLHELIDILNDFRRMMKDFNVTEYRACAKSALREARNRDLILEAVYQETGIRIDVLSNPEQRFLTYKSIAACGDDFRKFIEKGTAIIDLGGGSVQISLFDKDALVATQNIAIGSIRIREELESMERFARHYDELVEEYISKDIQNFKRMYLKNRQIENIILVGNYFTNLIFQNQNDTSKMESREEFMAWYDSLIRKNAADLTGELGAGSEIAHVVIPSAVVYKRMIEELGASTIWLPGIQLTDGIAYDYADRHRIIHPAHNFEQDILAEAKHISKRFAGDKTHTAYVMHMAETIFDAVKKTAGLTPRDKLLLKVAVLLYDCGKYVSLTNVGMAGYNIVMSTEIIGLSTSEREMIASIIRFNTESFIYYQEYEGRHLSRSEYLRIGRLTAILRLANALDESHKMKVSVISAEMKKTRLVIRVATKDDYTLEEGSFYKRQPFFNEIFCMDAELKVRKERN